MNETPKLVREYTHKYADLAGIDPTLIEQSAVNVISDASVGSPREINRIIYKIVRHLPKDGPIPTIDREFVNRAIGEPRPREEPVLDGLHRVNGGPWGSLPRNTRTGLRLQT